MAFDALTLSAVRDELEPLLLGARIQKLVFPDELSIAVELFAPGPGRSHVLLSSHVEHGRVQRIPHLPARGLERETPFSLIVRKYLRGAHMSALRQPRLERVLQLVCEQREAPNQRHGVTLIVEAMGRRSNLVLVDEGGTILDAARRTPPSRNPRRPVLPHLPYEAPPPQPGLLPEQLSVGALASGAQGRTGLLASYLRACIAGLSPVAARELAFRATGAADAELHAVDWSRVLEATLAFFAPLESHAWAPAVAFAAEDGKPMDFASYSLSHLAAAGAHVELFATISEAIGVYYARLEQAGPAARGDVLRAERRALQAVLDVAVSSTARRISALEHQLASGREQRDPLRHAGEAILAHQAELAPGSSELASGDERIKLDPLLSAVENAQAYFARYRRMREAEARVPELLEQARYQASHLADLSAMVAVADQMDAIRALRREVAAATRRAADGPGQSQSADRPSVGRPTSTRAPQRGRSGQMARQAPHRRLAFGQGWEGLLGTSAAGNAAVTFDLAEPEDLWLHARGVPGAHVILRTRGATPPEPVLERAAQIAAWHSAARAWGAVDVDVAPRRHVRKVPNAPPGLVRYTHERTMRVTPSA